MDPASIAGLPGAITKEMQALLERLKATATDGTGVDHQMLHQLQERIDKIAEAANPGKVNLQPIIEAVKNQKVDMGPLIEKMEKQQMETMKTLKKQSEEADKKLQQMQKQIEDTATREIEAAPPSAPEVDFDITPILNA